VENGFKIRKSAEAPVLFDDPIFTNLTLRARGDLWLYIFSFH